MVKKTAQTRPNEQLRMARRERGWTQKEVADRIGAPLSLNVTRWEGGTAFPSPHYIEKLCQIFGKSASELGLVQAEVQPVGSHFSEPSDSTLLWNVPYRRNPFFTGREEVLDHLRACLCSEHAAAITQTYALSGLGGMGKTQLAVEYAYRSREAYHAIFWARAASRETLIADFLSLADLVQLPGYDASDQMIVVAAVKRWLAQHRGWLLILDNADDLSLITDFLPAGREGHLLLTTRASATGKIASSITVEKMSLDEGSLLLLRRAKLLSPDASLAMAPALLRTQAQAIVRAVDGLPLALDQAAAYMEETGCSLTEYWELFQQHRRDLLNRQSSVSPDYPYTVASTWSLSFEQVEQASPAAADLLRLCAFLDPDVISEAMLSEGAAALGPLLEPTVSDALQLHEAVSILRRFSLVRRDAEAKALNLHRLVQVVLKDAMDDAIRRLWAERTVRALSLAFPEAEFSNWSRCQECLPHIQVCVELIDHYTLIFPEAAQLLTHAGWYLRERALYTQAEPLLQRALVMSQQVLGGEHPNIATILIHLGWLYQQQGLYEQAEPLYRRALALREYALGLECPEIADVLYYLSWLYQQQGQYKQAEPLLQRALTICEHTLGVEHRITSDILNDLAYLYYTQGRYTQAEPLYQRALSICEQVRGPDHPDTATILDNLAVLYRTQGRYTQVEPLLQRALAIYEQALGPDHPDVASSLTHLGWLYQTQDHYAQAEPLHRRALTIREQVLGPAHPQVAKSLTHLAELYRVQGQYAQAEALCQRALAIREHKLGSDHPETAITLNSLAHLYRDQGQYEQAQILYQRVLTIREQMLSPDHPDTAIVLADLARLYQDQGHCKQAELLYQRALSIQERLLGPDHPNTLTTRENYSRLRVQGCTVVSTQVLAGQRKETVLRQTSGPASAPSYPAGLTAREVEVLRLVAQGLTSAQIAEQLTITVLTVNSHVRSIYSKLGVTSRSAATRYALEQKLG